MDRIAFFLPLLLQAAVAAAALLQILQLRQVALAAALEILVVLAPLVVGLLGKDMLAVVKEAKVLIMEQAAAAAPVEQVVMDHLQQVVMVDQALLRL
jgi:hypothetical protein